MTDLRDDLRALVVRWRTEAADEQRVSFCADELDAILVRQGAPPDVYEHWVQRERDLYEMVQHHRQPSTPPMTREALEEAEKKDALQSAITEIREMREADERAASVSGEAEPTYRALKDDAGDWKAETERLRIEVERLTTERDLLLRANSGTAETIQLARRREQ